MILTVYIDDSSKKGKKLLHNLQNERDVVHFELPFNSGSQNGYMSGSEFRTSVKKGLVDKLKEDGRL